MDVPFAVEAVSVYTPGSFTKSVVTLVTATFWFLCLNTHAFGSALSLTFALVNFLLTSTLNGLAEMVSLFSLLDLVFRVCISMSSTTLQSTFTDRPRSVENSTLYVPSSSSTFEASTLTFSLLPVSVSHADA